MLYDGVKQLIKDDMIRKGERIAAIEDEVEFMQVLGEIWDEYKLTMMMTRDILMYMDRTYCSQSKLTGVYDVGLEQFYEETLIKTKVRDRLHKFALGWIERDRNDELIDRQLLKNLLAMLVDLGVNSTRVYEADFEEEFLTHTAQFYRLESQAFIDQNSCPDYLKKAEERIQQEHARVHHYLHASTEKKLKNTVEKELIKEHAKFLVDMENSGCRALIRDEKYDDLTRLFSLFSKVPEVLCEIRRSMQDYVKELGNDLVKSQKEKKDPKEFVTRMLKMRKKTKEI